MNQSSLTRHPTISRRLWSSWLSSSPPLSQPCIWRPGCCLPLFPPTCQECSKPRLHPQVFCILNKSGGFTIYMLIPNQWNECLMCVLANSDVPAHCAQCSDGMRRKYEGKVNMKSPQPGMPASADHTRHVQWKAAWGGRGDQRDGQDVRWIGRGVCIDVTVDVHEVSMTMYHIIVESIYTYYIYHTCIYMYYCHQVINILRRQKTSYLTWTRHSKELFLRNDSW